MLPDNLIRRYALYLLRWQLSTLILAPCMAHYAPLLGAWGATILANLIGGLLFFWFDLYFVFRKPGKYTSCTRGPDELY